MGPNVAPHGSGEMKLVLPRTWRKADVLYLTAKDPAGRELWTWSWGLNKSTNSTTTNAQAKTPPSRIRDDVGAAVIKAGPIELGFSKQTGALVEVGETESCFPFGLGPRFVAFRRNDRKYDSSRRAKHAHAF